MEALGEPTAACEKIKNPDRLGRRSVGSHPRILAQQQPAPADLREHTNCHILCP